MAIKSPILIALAAIGTVSLTAIVFLYLDGALMIKHLISKSNDSNELSTTKDPIISESQDKLSTNHHNSTTAADLSFNSSIVRIRSLLSVENMFLEQVPLVDADLNSLIHFAYMNFDHSFNSSSFKVHLIDLVQKKLHQIEEKYDVLKKQFALFYNQSRSDDSVKNVEKKFKRVHGLIEVMDGTPVKVNENFFQLMTYKPFKQTVIKYSLAGLAVIVCLASVLCIILGYWNYQ